MTATGEPDIPGASRIAEHLAAQYDIRIAGLERLQAWSPFVHRVDRLDGCAWVVRLFPAERAIDRVAGDAAILEFLDDHRYPAERAATPAAVSSVDDHGLLVTEYIDGVQFDDFQRGAARRSALDALRRLGTLLGQLHTLPLDREAVTRDAGSWHYDVSEGLPREDIAGGHAMLAAVANVVPAEHRARYDSLREQLAAADDCHDLPRALVHPDFGGSNVIVRDDGSA